MCIDDEFCGDIFEGCCLFIIYNGDFVVLCIFSYFINLFINYLLSFVLLFEVNVIIWQIDVNGDVISIDIYLLLFEFDEDDICYYFMYVYDINN